MEKTDLEKARTGNAAFDSCPTVLKVVSLIKRRYGCDPEFLWNDDNAIFRNPDNDKWFAAIVFVKSIVPGKDEPVQKPLLNIAHPAERIGGLVDNWRILPGWHMNKKYWISLKLSEEWSEEELEKLIDISYEIAEKKGRKKKKEPKIKI